MEEEDGEDKDDGQHHDDEGISIYRPFINKTYRVSK